MNFKETIQEIRNIVLKLEPKKVETVQAAEIIIVEEPKAAEEVKAEVIAEVKDGDTIKEVKAEEVKTEEVKLDDTAPAEPNLAALQAEIIDLRNKVGVLQEYVWLKEAYEQLMEKYGAMQAGFSEAINKTLALVEQIAVEPTGEPIQEKKNGVKLDGKKKNLSKYFA